MIPSQFLRAGTGPQHQEQVEGGEDAPADPRPVAQGRRDRSTRPGRVAHRPGEPRSDEDDDAVDDRRPRHLGEQARPDDPGGADGVAHGLPGAERVDDVVADGAPDHEEKDADEEEGDTDVAEHRAAAARQPDGARVECDRDQDDEPAHPLDQLHARLGSLELVGLEDHDLPDVRWQPRVELVAETELRPDVDHERAQVERDHAAARRDVAACLVLEDGHQLLVGDPVGGLPEVLDARALQEAVDALDGGLAERPRDRAGESLEVRRKPLLHHRLRVGAFVELVDDVDGERHAHLVVLEQLRARVDPGVGVERLPLDPEGEGADEDDERPERGAHPGED